MPEIELSYLVTPALPTIQDVFMHALIDAGKLDTGYKVESVDAIKIVLFSGAGHYNVTYRVTTAKAKNRKSYFACYHPKRGVEVVCFEKEWRA